MQKERLYIKYKRRKSILEIILNIIEYKREKWYNQYH